MGRHVAGCVALPRGRRYRGCAGGEPAQPLRLYDGRERPAGALWPDDVPFRAPRRPGTVVLPWSPVRRRAGLVRPPVVRSVLGYGPLPGRLHRTAPGERDAAWKRRASRDRESRLPRRPRPGHRGCEATLVHQLGGCRGFADDPSRRRGARLPGDGDRAAAQDSRHTAHLRVGHAAGASLVDDGPGQLEHDTYGLRTGHRYLAVRVLGRARGPLGWVGHELRVRPPRVQPRDRSPASAAPRTPADGRARRGGQAQR